MAKVKLNWFIEGLKGKVADCNKEIKSHSILVNPYTGESITRNNGVRNLTTNPYSADELARQAKFKAAAAALIAFFSALGLTSCGVTKATISRPAEGTTTTVTITTNNPIKTDITPTVDLNGK